VQSAPSLTNLYHNPPHTTALYITTQNETPDNNFNLQYFILIAALTFNRM